MSPLVSIVIVNFNAGEYLDRCLKCLEEQTFRDFEIVVVDNNSQDDSLAAAELRRWVKIIRNQANLGFAAAQNQGMRQAGGQILVPLNFDICLTPDFLQQVTEALAANPRVGTVSGKLMRMQPDGTCTKELDNAGLLLNPRRHPVHRGRHEQDLGQYQQRELVFGAMGAAAVFRRAMLDDIAYKNQYFDESFFTWWEDIDLDWRGRLRGWDCLYLPEAVAFHVGDPQHNETTAFAAYHGIRNRWQMVLANDCLHCVAREIRWLAVEEFELFRHVVKFHLVKPYLLAIWAIASRFPAILEKRRWVQSRAVRSCLPDYPIPFET